MESISKPSRGNIGRSRRQAVKVAPESMVNESHLPGYDSLPLVLSPQVSGLNFLAWAKNNRAYIEKHLLHYGGILFRDFQIEAVEEFEEFVTTVAGGLLEYRERSSPRSQVKGNIYTSTDYPADQPIFLHNENSYQSAFPTKICFFCVTPAAEGGATPIANCRKVYDRIAPDIRQKFADKQAMYVRNFGDGFGLSWENVFQTSDKAVVEAYCKKAGIQIEWRTGNRLRTRTIRPAVIKHPQTSEMVWFNHATFFHITTLPEAIQRSLRSEFDEADLPANTYYGDGSPIEPDVVAALRDAYHQETVAFPWQKGDIILLDNLSTAHGRAPYSGARKIVVGMTEPLSWENL